jgi:predicted TIM-barrel enzyme
VKETVLDACERGLTDAIIVTGGRTGEPPPLQLVQFVKGSITETCIPR